jgi:predicted ribosome quality control (RQC) complex YloA/Tae2 family protein
MITYKSPCFLSSFMDVAGIDIYHIVKELQPIVGSKVQKAYGNDDYSLILDFYGFKYRYVFVDLPDILRFSNEKGVMPRKPTGFVERSRKHLQGLRISSVQQNGIDRIIVFELEGRLQRKLIIELFAKGNIIICDENDRMLTVLRQEAYASRVVKAGKQYAFPPKSSTVMLDDYDSFRSSIMEYNDNHMLSVIAQSGYGGKYAERILRHVMGDGFDAKATIKSIGEEKLERIYERIVQYKNACSYETKNDGIIINPEGNGMNSIIDLLAVKQEIIEVETREDVKEDKQDRIVRMQKERAEKLSAEAEEKQQAGSIIFERYEDIKRALDYAKEYKKKNGSLKGLEEQWPESLPKLIKITDDGRYIEIDL